MVTSLGGFHRTEGRVSSPGPFASPRLCRGKVFCGLGLHLTGVRLSSYGIVAGPIPGYEIPVGGMIPTDVIGPAPQLVAYAPVIPIASQREVAWVVCGELLVGYGL